MEFKKMVFTAFLLATPLSQAVTFQGDDFNKMIQQNQEVESKLRNQLQKEAGIDLDSEKPGSVAKEKIQPPAEAEQVIVSSKKPLWQEKKSPTAKQLQKADMKRISQELDEAAD